ncbi:hypothetical protein CRM22_010350 [Opisthorchis felineus]|uniref:Uncharacterized protein n=1 Tax=Opisthorchis felineus TaxID=147828 RepID=A0A4S2L4V9_OPIFE|nr:hypothetical protein CRM22_010350 [Opisthorchis felineus]
MGNRIGNWNQPLSEHREDCQVNSRILLSSVGQQNHSAAPHLLVEYQFMVYRVVSSLGADPGPRFRASQVSVIENHLRTQRQGKHYGPATVISTRPTRPPADELRIRSLAPTHTHVAFKVSQHTNGYYLDHQKTPHFDWRRSSGGHLSLSPARCLDLRSPVCMSQSGYSAGVNMSGRAALVARPGTAAKRPYVCVTLVSADGGGVVLQNGWKHLVYCCRSGSLSVGTCIAAPRCTCFVLARRCVHFA